MSLQSKLSARRLKAVHIRPDRVVGEDGTAQGKEVSWSSCGRLGAIDYVLHVTFSSPRLAALDRKERYVGLLAGLELAIHMD